MTDSRRSPRSTASEADGYNPCAILIGLLLSAGTAFAANPGPDPFLKVVGNVIRDDRGQGDVVALRGVNLGGWLVFEGWMCPMDSSGLKDDDAVRATLERRFGSATRDRLLAIYEDTFITEADLDNIAAMGMNVIRLPFWYRTVQEEDGAWRLDAFTRLDWLVKEAGRRGIYTILDLHGVPGGQSEGESTGRVRKKAENGLEPEFWTNNAHQRRTIEIWRRVAEHYKGNPSVAAYDLINEPFGAPSRDALWSAYERLYQAIRAVDPDHIITVEGCWSGQVDGKTIGWGWDTLPPPSRFGWTNVVYQMHNYEWDWNNLDKQIRSVDRQVEEAKAHSRWNVPGFLGEFNVMAHEKAWKYAIEQYSSHDIGWAVWTYKAIHGSGSNGWGVYNPRDPMPPKPDIQHDSAETIAEKWSKWGTAAAFAINPMLRRTLAMPVPVNDSYTVESDTPLTVGRPGVLANDTHLNLGEPGLRHSARIVSGPSHGTLTLNEDGSFTYTPQKGPFDTDSFRYRVFDGRLDSARIGTVVITVKP